MPVLHLEFFDSVVAPAIPPGWNADAAFSTVSGSSISIPNYLLLASSALSPPRYCTWGTADSANGNVTVSTYFYYGGSAGDQIGVTARGSAATLNYGSTTQYECQLQVNLPGQQLIIQKVTSGVPTTIVSISTGSSPIAANQWYQLLFSLSGPSLSAAVRRNADGYWLTTGWSWQPTEAAAISTNNSAISGSGYCGLLATQGASAQTLAFDNWELDGGQLVTWPAMYRTTVLPPDNSRFWV